MNPPLPKTLFSSYGTLALSISLGGTALAVFTGLAAHLLGCDALPAAYVLFAASQIAALVIGWRFRREPLGRESLITASILLILSLGLLT